MMERLPQRIVAVSALLILLEASAGAEFSIFVYFGKSLTGKGDLHLRKGDSDLEFQGVRWEDNSFKAPIFYGIRAGYWFDHSREWGVALDFTHAKAILRENEKAVVRGYRKGSRVEAWETISDSIPHFELSHGLNMVTLNGMHRWFANDLRCYTGVGAGFSVPHVEAHLADGWTGGYQFPAGPVVSGMAGLEYELVRGLSGALEYKISYAPVHGDLNGGGYLEAPTLTHQFISGVAGNFSP